MAGGLNFSVSLSVEESGKKRPEYTLDSDINGEVSFADFLEYVKSVLVSTASVVLKEEQANGFEKNPVVVVDGRYNKPIELVSPLGSISFVAKADMKEIIRETFDGLIKRSPILTGAYISSHFVFLNNRQVAKGQNSLDAWLDSNPVFNENDFIWFVNAQPYARKLERLGVTGDRQHSRTVQSRDKYRAAQGYRVVAPNGAYFLTARSIRAKYKFNTLIKFMFIPGSSLGLSGTFKQGKKSSIGRSYLYPAIVLSVQQKGSF